MLPFPSVQRPLLTSYLWQGQDCYIIAMWTLHNASYSYLSLIGIRIGIYGAPVEAGRWQVEAGLPGGRIAPGGPPCDRGGRQRAWAYQGAMPGRALPRMEAWQRRGTRHRVADVSHIIDFRHVGCSAIAAGHVPVSVFITGSAACLWRRWRRRHQPWRSEN